MVRRIILLWRFRRLLSLVSKVGNRFCPFGNRPGGTFEMGTLLARRDDVAFLALAVGGAPPGRLLRSPRRRGE